MKIDTDIYVLAHEIKNPLSVVKGYLEMLNADNIEKYKEIIEEELDTSIEILDNYMNYNKITINKEEMDLNLLLTDINRTMKDYLKKKGIKLKIDLLDDDIYLNADYQKLKQVLYNIIKNSVEAEAKNISIHYEISSKKVKIIIKNDGYLINNLDKIGTSYTDKILGHGIGTKISHKIIEMHEGKIKYLNEDDGVSCIITLSLS